MNSPWKPVTPKEPMEDVTVETANIDKDGERNTQKLRRFRGLWFFPDKSMYVYYAPTHWRECDEVEHDKPGAEP